MNLSSIRKQYLNEWQLVERKIFTSSATSYTFNGLDGNLDKRYKIIMYIINNYNGNMHMYYYGNGDTGNNYYYQRIQSYLSYVSGAYNNATSGYITAIAQNEWGFTSLYIVPISGKHKKYWAESMRYNSTDKNIIEIYCGHHSLTDNYTSLSISSDQGNGIGIGSYIELWKLAQ